jgi:hypothetical protein
MKVLGRAPMAGAAVAAAAVIGGGDGQTVTVQVTLGELPGS